MLFTVEKLMVDNNTSIEIQEDDWQSIFGSALASGPLRRHPSFLHTKSKSGTIPLGQSSMHDVSWQIHDPPLDLGVSPHSL